ncbi:energy transducer TonB [Dyadobacter sandarakinus]|uniref:TonB family protein n=1 Tax=Dyadobacter sandarakinus TaxID=2747268 RepID=A0ABX7I4G6_9BACT|nr:energy transducer TonB [Dyadobacter sandarakinus]QRR00670.1 TonB family protein [Dyadobacter sandarakinus]
MKLLLTIMILAALPALAQDPLQPHEVTRQAVPTGGIQVLNQFISSNLRIPFTSALGGINSRVYLKGVVEPDGSMTGIEVTRGIDPQCDEEAKRVLGLYKAWTPAELNGKPARQIVHFPITFREDPKTSFDSSMHAMVIYLDNKFRLTDQPDKAEFRRILSVNEDGYVNKDVRFDERRGNKWKPLFTVPFRKQSMYYKNEYVRTITDSVKSYRIFVQDQNLASYAPEAVFSEDGRLLAFTQIDEHGKTSLRKEFDLNGLLREMHIHDDSTDTEVRWYSNGQIRSVVIHPANKPAIKGTDMYSDAWEPDGTQNLKDGNGYWRAMGLDYEHKPLLEEGRIVSGAKSGVWTGKRPDSTLHYREFYHNGMLEKGVSYYGTDSVTYSNPVKQPEFKGGINAFYRYLAQNIRYPGEAARRGAVGKVMLTFVVCEDGTMCDYKVLNSIGFGLDEEALRVVKGMNGMWNPGEMRGKTVRVQYNLPINFQLN